MTAIFLVFFDDFMRYSNFGIGVLHVKHQILTYFCDVISLLALVFIVSFDRAYKEVSTKNIEKKFLWSKFQKNPPCQTIHAFTNFWEKKDQ